MSIIFSVELDSVILLASSSMSDTSPVCVSPCNPTSTRSQSTSLRYHSTDGGISTSSTSDTSSPLFFILTTTATNTTSASVSLSSSVCVCPCSIASSASYLLCKYAYWNRLAYTQNFQEKWNESSPLYLSQDASSSISEWLTFFLWASRFSFKK